MGISWMGISYNFYCRLGMRVLDKKGLDGVIRDQHYSVRYIFQIV